MRFNPPPGWPQPPQGWTPPPGWEPDPSWPAPPPGWQLWIDDARTRVMPQVPRAVPRPGPKPAPQPYRSHPSLRPWYQRTGWIVALLILCFPVGIALTWMRKDWPTTARGVITAVVAVLFLLIAASTQSPTQTAANSGTSKALTTPTVTAAASASSAAAAPTSAPAATSVAAAAPPPTTQAPPPTTQAAPPPPATSAAPAGDDLCGAPSNPYGYNFCGDGGYIYSPGGSVCTYFDCIGNFSNGHGYMVECSDGTYSMSGGIRGECSDHGGEEQPVYSG